MPLKGEAKKVYQRDYMRQRRLKGGLLDLVDKTPVRPGLEVTASMIRRLTYRPEIDDIMKANPVMSRSIQRRLAVQRPDLKIPDIDDDGNVIPEY